MQVLLSWSVMVLSMQTGKYKRGPSVYSGILTLKRLIHECFYDQQNRRDFEQWYFEKYGVPYEWKRCSENEFRCDQGMQV